MTLSSLSAVEMGGLAKSREQNVSITNQGGDAAHLEGTMDLVEGVAVVAHDLAGAGDVVEFLGQMGMRYAVRWGEPPAGPEADFAYGSMTTDLVRIR